MRVYILSERNGYYNEHAGYDDWSQWNIVSVTRDHSKSLEWSNNRKPIIVQDEEGREYCVEVEDEDTERKIEVFEVE